jgi:hypothetical protein
MNRKRSARLTVLMATDGSRQAHAALAFAAAVPWAGTATAHMVLARGACRSGRGRLTSGLRAFRTLLTGLSSERYRGRVALSAIAGLT